MTVGEILAALRKEHNIGQKELAIYLNVSTGTVSNYEHNVHSPDLAAISRLADYFGVTADYLLGRTSCRYDPRLLNQRISTQYTVTDIVDLVLTFDNVTADKLMEYARFLQARR